MADNYIQGTVSPTLPLKPWHLAVRDIFWMFSPGDIPDGLDFTDGKLTLTDEVLFRETLSTEIGYEGDLDKMLEGLELLLQCGDEFLHFSTEKCHDDTYYLYAEDGLGDTDLAFLQWVIKDMPPEIEWISCEFAFYCSKLRPDEFGGGAWFITRQDTETMFTGSWLAQQQAKLQEGHGVREEP